MQSAAALRHPAALSPPWRTEGGGGIEGGGGWRGGEEKRGGGEVRIPVHPGRCTIYKTYYRAYSTEHTL
jgi:hypothetical protein